MPNYAYLIIGSGMTSAAAIGGIREVDRAGSIGVIGAEAHPPYDRPPLSKGLWKDKPFESIWRKTEDNAVTLHLEKTANALDPRNKRVTDDQGTTYTYDKLLLATGCTPRRLSFGDDQIIYFRTVDDYQRLRGLTEHDGHFAVIGPSPDRFPRISRGCPPSSRRPSHAGINAPALRAVRSARFARLRRWP